MFEGVTVLVSTAYLDEAERCHRLLLVHQGRTLFFGTPADLKRMLPGGVLSISSPNPEAVRTAATAEQGVLRATAMGDGVHVVVDDPDRRLIQLRERFECAGILFGDMRLIPPSVEDVFVYVISRQQTPQGS